MAESIDDFKAKGIRFVADWLKSKGLDKLCCVFEGILKNILNCIYNVNNNSIQYGRCMIRFIKVNCFDRPGVFMNI